MDAVKRGSGSGFITLPVVKVIYSSALLLFSCHYCYVTAIFYLILRLTLELWLPRCSISFTAVRPTLRNSCMPFKIDIPNTVIKYITFYVFVNVTEA